MNAGFALLEVLISMVIAMVGVLGVAGIQLLAINNTGTARCQNQAAILASSMAAQMQANVAYWGSPPTNVGVTNNMITVGSGSPTTPTSDCFLTVCSAQQLAYYDLQSWGVAMASALPLAVGQPLPSGGGNVAYGGVIACPTVSPMVCQITIYWSENNIALSSNNQSGATGLLAPGKSAVHQYTTLVSIQ